MGYSYKIENEADFAKARVEDVNASFKDLAEVCYNIRRRPAGAAVGILQEAKEGRRPLRYRSHSTGLGHRKQLRGQKGRWPMKAAGIVLKCLQSAISNAREKGLSEELIVVHATANMKRTYMRYSSKGRRNASRLQTSRVEIVLKEKEEGKKKRVEREKIKAEEEKKEAKAEARKKDAEAQKKEGGEGASPKKEAEVAKKAVKGEGAEANLGKETKPASGKAEEKKAAPGKEAAPKAAEKKPEAKTAEKPKKEAAPAKKKEGAKPKTGNPKPKTRGEGKEVK